MKRLSYCLFIVTLVLAVPISCSDDGDSVNRKLLLTDVERNGVKALTLFYDTERLLTRANTYSDGDLFNYMLYEYNDKGIEEARRYEGDDHSLSLKALFTLDDFGRVSRIEYYTAPTDFEKIQGVFMYDYEASGQLKSRRFYMPPSIVEEYRDEFAYDAAGHRITSKRIIDPGQPKEYVSYQIEYTPGTEMISEHWNDFTLLLSVTNLDDNIREMFNTASHRTSWDSDGSKGTELRTEATDQIFNGDGYLTRQILTRVFLSHQSPNEVTELTYKYTE